MCFQLKVGVSAAKYAEIARAIRDAVSSSHGLALACVCLLKTRTIPKTTSGKIARAWCRRGYLEGSLQVLHRVDCAEGDGGNGGEGGAALVVEDGDGEGKESQLGEETHSGAAAGSASTGKKVGSGGTNYAKVHLAEEGEGEGEGEGASSGGQQVPEVHIPGQPQSAEEVRALPLEEVATQLEKLLLQVAAQGPSPLTAPLDRAVPVSAMGLDSMTLVQFKGVLDKRFVCIC